MKSLHSEGDELVKNIEDVGVEVLSEEQGLQRRAVLLNLKKVDKIYHSNKEEFTEVKCISV